MGNTDFDWVAEEDKSFFKDLKAKLEEPKRFLNNSSKLYYMMELNRAFSDSEAFRCAFNHLSDIGSSRVFNPRVYYPKFYGAGYIWRYGELELDGLYNVSQKDRKLLKTIGDFFNERLLERPNVIVYQEGPEELIERVDANSRVMLSNSSFMAIPLKAAADNLVGSLIAYKTGEQEISFVEEEFGRFISHTLGDAIFRIK